MVMAWLVAVTLHAPALAASAQTQRLDFVGKYTGQWVSAERGTLELTSSGRFRALLEGQYVWTPDQRNASPDHRRGVFEIRRDGERWRIAITSLDEDNHKDRTWECAVTVDGSKMSAIACTPTYTLRRQ